VVLRVEFDGLGKQGDGGVVILSLKGFVSLVFEFVDLCVILSVIPPRRVLRGQRRHTVDMVLGLRGGPQE